RTHRAQPPPLSTCDSSVRPSLRNSPKVRKWFKDNWSKDPFESEIKIGYTGKYGTDPFDWFGLLHPRHIIAYTNQYTGEQLSLLRGLRCHRTRISGHRRTRQRRPLKGWSKVVDYGSSGVAVVGMSEAWCRWRS